jgi:YidC/Oxa1 family membrane protein insertase
VETDLLKVAVSTQGGAIRTWELKKYRFGGKRAEEHVQLVYQGVDAVYPLSFVPDKITATNPASELYAPSAQHLVTDQQHPTAELLLTYEDPARDSGSKS